MNAQEQVSKDYTELEGSLRASCNHLDLGHLLAGLGAQKGDAELFLEAIASFLIADEPTVAAPISRLLVENGLHSDPRVASFHYFAHSMIGDRETAEATLELLSHMLPDSKWVKTCRSEGFGDCRAILHGVSEFSAGIHGLTPGIDRSKPSLFEAEVSCPVCGSRQRVRFQSVLQTAFVPCSKCGTPSFVHSTELRKAMGEQMNPIDDHALRLINQCRM